jgi:hypothetical protein
MSALKSCVSFVVLCYVGLLCAVMGQNSPDLPESA